MKNRFTIFLLAALICFHADNLLADTPPPFSDNENPKFENTYSIDNLTNNSGDGDVTLRINRKAPFDCKNKTDCPASVIVSNKTGNVNIPVDLNVGSLSVGKTPIIDASGKWVSPNNSGLKGDKGDSCAIVETRNAGSVIKCGTTVYPMSRLRGTDGKNGDSCAIDADGNIQCGSGLAVNVRGVDGKNGAEGKNGDSCSIDSAGNIKCGNAAPVNVRGTDGRDGDSCTIDASGNVKCGSGQAINVRGTDGKSGDSCSIDTAGNVRCGNGQAVNVRGADGKNGDSCTIDASGNVKCGSGQAVNVRGADGKNGDSCSIDSTGNVRCGNGQAVNVRGTNGQNGDSCSIDADGNVKCGSNPSVNVRGPAGKNGDSCSIDASGNVKCGSAAAVNVKGAAGRNGESCVQGSSIYPACLDSLMSQNLFKTVSSQNVSQKCQFISAAVYLKRFAATCPASHPFAVGGGCGLSNFVSEISQRSSMPLATGKGWQCELTATNDDQCEAAVMNVWTTCSRIGVDNSAAQ